MRHDGLRKSDRWRTVSYNSSSVNLSELPSRSVTEEQFKSDSLRREKQMARYWNAESMNTVALHGILRANRTILRM